MNTEKDRTLVHIEDCRSYNNDNFFLYLTNDQINLLDWLKNHDFLYEEITYTAMNDNAKIEIV